MMGRVMAIDHGDARTGIAISDPSGTIAGFTTVIASHRAEKTVEEIAQLVRERDVKELVMGFPKNMDGTESRRAEIYRSFAGKLEEATGIRPVLWDERRTTIEAHGILHENGKRMKNHRKNVDAVAATLILEGYLARRRQSST